MGNELTDPENIRNQFQNEFLYGLRQREPKEHIKCHETLQNDLCMLRIENHLSHDLGQGICTLQRCCTETAETRG